MNNLVNEKVINSLFDDKDFNTELKAMLNKMIDEELEKDTDEIDCDLIEECTDMLIELEQKEDNGFAVLIPMMSSDKIMAACKTNGFKYLSRGMRASLIACIILLSALTANTVIAKVFDYNVAQEVVNSISEKLQDWGIIASADEEDEIVVDKTPVTTTEKHVESTTQPAAKAEKKQPPAVQATTEKAKSETPAQTTAKPEIKDVAVEIKEDAKPVALRLAFSKDFKTEYLWGESLDTRGLTVTAVYDGGATRTVDTADCTFKGYNKALEGTQKIAVTYDGASATFEITLKKTAHKTERTVTGVQASFPTKLIYTTEDTKLSLDGMRAKLLYSDGSYSDWYYPYDMQIIRDADFSQIGAQKITVRIADKADFEFEIVVKEPEVLVKDIEEISIKTSRFYVGDDLSNFYIYVYYKNAPAEKIYYADDEESFTVLGLDTSIETLGTSKSFTVYYKGFTVSARYTVVSRKVVLSAQITPNAYTNLYPKFLYYYGEELGIGKGVNSNEIIPNLKSSQLIDGEYNFGTTTGFDWRLKVHFSDTAYNTSYDYLYAGQLDFCGYDPYKIGYQTIDIFYDGIYITSMIVFVYGDDGYAPIHRSDFYIVFGKEKEQLASNGWLKCMGDGVLSYDNNLDDLYDKYGLNNKKLSNKEYRAAYEKMTEDPWFKVIVGQDYLYAQLDDENATGWQNATLTLTDGTVYSYKVCHVYDVNRLYVKNAPEMLKIKVEDLASPDLSNLEFSAKFTDGSIVPIPSDDIIFAFCIIEDDEEGGTDNIWNGGTITENSPINSAFGRMKFSLNRDKYIYSSHYFYTIDAYCYKAGYEDFNLMVEPDYSSDEDTFAVGTSDEDIIKRYTYKLQSYENFMRAQGEVTLSNIDTGKAGTYETIFTVTLDGKTYSDTRTIYIVEKLSRSEFKMTYDANKGKTFVAGDVFDASESKFTYTFKNGKTIDVSPSDVYVKIDGSKDTTVGENKSDDFLVRYSYNGYSFSEYYSMWGVINFLNFRYDKSKNGIYAYWTEIEDAEYYTVKLRKWITTKEYEDYTYQTTTNDILIDTNLVNGAYQQFTLFVTAVRTKDGKEITGLEKQANERITITGYIPPEN